MRTAATFLPPLRALLAFVVLLAAAGPVAAQKAKVRITSARVGLPPGGRATDRDDDLRASHICKFAVWAPVYVTLEVLDDVKGPAELIVETPDADGVSTTLVTPLALTDIRPGTTLSARELGVFPYLRPSAGSGETTVTVRSSNGGTLSEPYRLTSLRPNDSFKYVVLGLGSKLPGFDLPKPATGVGETEGSPSLLRGGRVELASITDVDMLPDQWFGYEAADVVVFTTGSDGFLKRLFADPGSPTDKIKRTALLEWVRRGGRLVLSVGTNAGLVAQMPAILDLLPSAIKADAPIRLVAQLPLFWSARETSQTSSLGGTLAAKTGSFPVANLVSRPNRAGRVIIPPPARRDELEPVAVQAGYGLGRVTMIGFDLDRPPFTEFSNRVEFWDWVLREGGASRASVGSEGKIRAGSIASDEEDALASVLRTHIDTFDGVPVISFGWVALFIALYILLIGPVEYYFLKRVLGRLELTWVTFPVIVLTVSLAAYLTAVAVKGRDLRVNKVDVVDVVIGIDPQTGKPGGRVYGTTWFSVFSPRIEAYTVGISPAKGWTTPGDSGSTLVGWVGGPRSGRASLIRRRYSYHTNPDSGAVADGLVDVPIQVWSTKSFTANWAGPIDLSAPVVESHLVHPPADPTRVIGTIVNRMPFDEVSDCVVFYAGQQYPLGTIVQGQTIRLVLDKGLPAATWLQDRAALSELQSRVYADSTERVSTRRADASSTNGTLPLWGFLFHEASLKNDEGVIPINDSLRRLDQSWRLTPENRDEVIVVGRVVPPSGPSASTFNSPASPSQLWLKGLPEVGKDCPPIPGAGRQETWVRLFLSVQKPSGAGP
jgi:hypothetical protein